MLTENLLRERRLERLLTKAQLAAKAGVSPHTVARAERGFDIGDVKQERIARALGVARRDLFPEREEVAS
jgi:transcriptional regulator with XRE-family HTH domain